MENFETWLARVQALSNEPTLRPGGGFWRVLFDQGMSPEEARERADDAGTSMCPGCDAAFDEECSCPDEDAESDGCGMCGTVDEPLLDMEEHGMLCATCAEEAEQQEREDGLERQRDYHADMKMDMKRHGEAMSFDRFMDRILITEGNKKVEAPMTPQRIRASRNQERPLNRIRYNGGK